MFEIFVVVLFKGQRHIVSGCNRWLSTSLDRVCGLMSKLGGYVPEGLFVVALWTVWVPKLDLGWNSCSFGVQKSWG